jgi:colanic acid biosynthesis glycosyl transferase WcaI
LLAYFKRIYKWVDLIAVPDRNFVAELKARGVAVDRILMLPHASDLEQLETGLGQQVRQQLNINDKFIVLYAGSFSRYYDVLNIANAVHLLKQRFPDVHLLLLGVGPDFAKIQKFIAKNVCANITLVGHVAPNEVGAYLSSADLFITSLVGETMPQCYCDHLTTKVCDYLMIGKAVVSVESGLVLGNFLKRIDAGFSVPAYQPEALADAIAFFVANPVIAKRCGDNARKFARTHLERKSIVERFESELIQKLCAKGKNAE